MSYLGRAWYSKAARLLKTIQDWSGLGVEIEFVSQLPIRDSTNPIPPIILPRMSLEDHAGDVIAKSRRMLKIAEDRVASAAGLSTAELSDYEDLGELKNELNWTEVANLLALDAGRLERMAKGWEPGQPDLGTWREFRQITTIGPTMDVHAYLIWDEVTREAAIFDTGFDPTPIFEIIDQEKLTPTYLFITHMHGDHVAGLEPIKNRYPDITMKAESDTVPRHCRNKRTDFLHLGSLRISNRDTPGHAVDGVTYIVGNFPDDAPSIAIVGDAIFAGSMGGAPNAGELAKQKVRAQILSLPDETLITPGHGPLTTVGEEKENNPFYP
jgi:hydroxyacylglutathione hydrolase